MLGTGTELGVRKADLQPFCSALGSGPGVPARESKTTAACLGLSSALPWECSCDPAKPAPPTNPAHLCRPASLPGIGALPTTGFQPLPQLTVLSLHSQPTFRAVEIGPDQNLTVAQVTGNSQELQMKNVSGPCLSLVSLSCLECGRSLKTPRVVGGVEASVDSWPWQVSIQYDRQHVCGGSILDPTWILTAAHCFRKHLDVSNWKVRVGSNKLSHFPSLPVAKIFVTEHNALHPKEKDIALVKLQSPLTFSDTVRPICLPFYDEELIPATPLWVIGWGFTEQNGGEMSDVLLQASVQVIDSTRCNAEDAYQGEVTEEMLCAGIPQGGVDTCQGDSGGPLMYHSDQWQVVGIVSWGHGCGSPSTPGVYTKVTAYLNWVYNVRKSEM